MLIVDGILYGIVISFITYFAVLSFRIKSPSAFWFTLYILCFVILWVLNSSMGPDLHHAGASGSFLPLLILFTGLLYFFGLKFFRTFFAIEVYSGKLDRAILVFQWMGLGFIPVNLLHSPVTFPFNLIVAGIGPVFSSAVAVFLCIRGNPPLRYFTAGWFAVQVTCTLLILHVFSLIPFFPATRYLLPALFFISIICFGIAILENNHTYSKYAFIDHLTGMANRRLFEQVLTIEWNRNLRKQLPISVVIADIDNFKSFQEAYGHSKALKCIQSIAGVFDKNLQRAGDLTARYDNDVFIAVLPDTTASEASFLGEKIREAVEKLAIRHERSSTGKILTLSVGACSLIPKIEKESADVVINADKAVFQAKNQGGNRVVSMDQT